MAVRPVVCDENRRGGASMEATCPHDFGKRIGYDWKDSQSLLSRPGMEPAPSRTLIEHLWWSLSDLN